MFCPLEAPRFPVSVLCILRRNSCHTCFHYWSAYPDGGPSWCQAWHSRSTDRVCRWRRDCILIPLPAKFYVLLAQPSVCLSSNISFYIFKEMLMLYRLRYDYKFHVWQVGMVMGPGPCRTRPFYKGLSLKFWDPSDPGPGLDPKVFWRVRVRFLRWRPGPGHES